MSTSSIQRRLFESTLVVVAYCVTAWMVVQAQAGVGGANLLWIPAGIALSAVLLRGAAMLPAVFVGVFTFNDLSLFSSASTLLQAAASATMTAIASTLQAWVTAWLLRRTIKNLQITTVSDALRFILCAAAGTTIAASVGTLMMLTQNKISGDAANLTWLTWWVGDLSGMLVVAPLVLLAQNWRRGKREWSLLSLPIISLGCSFTLVTAFIVKHLDHDARVNEFMSSGVAMGQSLQRTLDLSQRDLMATQVLFYNTEISRKEFHNFTAGLLQQNPLIRSLNWIPRVTEAERPQFEAMARRTVRPDYRIYDWDGDGQPIPAARRNEYLPVLLAEPASGGVSVTGFNVLSESKRSEAIRLARVAGQPRASRQVNMIRGGSAIVVYWPVSRNEFAEDGPVQDSDGLRGFVSMALEIGKLAQQTLSPFETRNAENWLIDVTDQEAPQLLYHHIDGREPIEATGPAPNIEHLRQGLYQETSHSFAGRQWLLISRPRDLDDGLKANGQFLGILTGGFGFTFMLALYMIGRQRSEHALRARDERLMSQNAVLTQLARFGLSPDANIERQLQELIATSAGTLKVERVSIWMLDPSARKLYCKTLFIRSTAEFTGGLTLDAENAPDYFASLHEGRGFAANNAQTDPRTREFAESYLKPLGITSMMDVPLRVGGKLAGVICHEHVGPARNWAPDEQNFAASIGDLASLVIESDMRRAAERALQDSYQALERKVQERTEELRTANERLRQLDQLKSMFIASMSHELRTPLNAIIGFTGVVLQGISGPLSEKQQDHLQRVYGSAKHLLALITDVIDISKIEAGYAEVYVESFSVNQLIEEAVATLQPQRLEKGLGLEVEAGASINASSDRKRLLQCLLNLLSNAIKYSEQGTVNVRLKADAERIVIEVADEGIGIAPEAVAKLFQPFERIDTHLRVKTPGTGLGLYLTRKIVTDLLQGDITATSQPGQGSTFSLWIPLVLQATKNDQEGK
ncbi:MAG TPA: CHASE domain-containing protein [Rhodocyclaceae bacterium]|nr:CHASE domain-containing protein [Rhodocyclaceae bacterium]